MGAWLTTMLEAIEDTLLRALAAQRGKGHVGTHALCKCETFGVSEADGLEVPFRFLRE